MKNLFYATFERGLAVAIKQFIKKQDKNSFVKKLYDDAVLFYGDEGFKQNAGCFKSLYVVLDSTKKLGAGAVNAEMKHLLERKDLKIYFPKEIASFKLVVSSESESVVVEPKLKLAMEIMLKRITKRAISFNATNAELMILAKKDGAVLFMKKNFLPQELIRFENRGEVSLDIAHILCFLSEPAQNETVVDPFAGQGKLAYVRACCFKKATVIANEFNEMNLPEMKKRAKALGTKQFSVMNYDFLSNDFPIKFIDKVITILPDPSFYGNYSVASFNKAFFDKLFELKVKTIVLMTSNNSDLTKVVDGKFDEVARFVVGRNAIVKFQLAKQK